MLNRRNILGLLFMTAVLVYTIYGDPDNFLWGSFYFATWNSLVVFLGSICLKSNRDKITRIVMKVFMGIATIKAGLNIYSFYNNEVFNQINRGWKIGLYISGCVLIFFIYSKYYGRLVKK